MEQRIKRTPESEREIEIDVSQLLRVIWQNLSSIILVALIGGIVALLYTMIFIHPTYRASFTAYVNNSNAAGTTDSLGSGDVNAAQSLARTYSKIMSSRPVIEDAARKSKLDQDYSYDALARTVSTSVEENTQLVNLSVTMRSPEDSYTLAKAIADVSPAYVANVVEGSSMKVVTNPVLPTKQNYPNTKRNTLLGLMLGALLMAAYEIIRALMDNRVKSVKELEERFGISVMGTIPNFHSADAASGYGGYYAKAAKRRGAKK